MDYDSSSKFITSLAKFLQSLCNGYVEFDNGVEVIGHIYLSVDTGKKIDYILNEKVCKTDQNSVTFISNSFHAQPAEKPKPPAPKAKEKVSTNGDDDDDIILMGEPASTNTGTIPTKDNEHNTSLSSSNFNNSPVASKRPHNQSNSNRPSKQRRTDSSHLNDSSNSQSHNSPSFNIQSEISNVTPASDSDISHLSQVLSDNTASNTEDRDVKPIIDSDMNVIINVKQEYDPGADPTSENQDTGVCEYIYLFFNLVVVYIGLKLYPLIYIYRFHQHL